MYHTKLTRTLLTFFAMWSCRRLSFTSSLWQYCLLCAALSALCALLYFCHDACLASRRSSSVEYNLGRAIVYLVQAIATSRFKLACQGQAAFLSGDDGAPRLSNALC